MCDINHLFQKSILEKWIKTLFNLYTAFTGVEDTSIFTHEINLEIDTGVCRLNYTFSE